MSTYPQSGTDHPRTELLIDGTWTDVSSYTRGPDGNAGVTITRGRAEAQQRVGAQTSIFTLRNTDGRFSSRNPSSPYFGSLPRNTQVRHLAGAAETFLRCTYSDDAGFNEARTADKAVLDIVSDLEVRADVWPHTWRPDGDSTGNRTMILASKYLITGNQRSWAFYLNTSGLLTLVWSPDGTSAARVFANATVAVPATSGRLSLKVTLDVNNGAAGNDVKFYTASSIGGSYTQLGATVTTAATTSVFSSTAALCVGTGDDSADIFTDGLTFGGRFYELRVYDGIGGTLVANPVFSSQTLGTTSFSDGLGTPNTWAVNGTARVCSDRVRFHGELASLAHTWDNTGTDITAAAQGAGMLRRLTAAGSPLRSPLYRQLDQFASVTGWWPMEDAADATALASALTGTNARSAPFGGLALEQSAGLTGAASTVAFSDATTGSIIFTPDTTAAVAATGILSYMFYVKLPSMPASTKTLVTLYTSGTARRIEIGLDATNWHIDFYAVDGSSLYSSTTAATNISPSGQWIGFNLLLETSGGNVSWSARWLVIGRGAAFFGISGATYAGTVGRALQVRMKAAGETAYASAAFGHLLIANADIGFLDTVVSDASNGYESETAADRIDRLCTEEGITSEITGMWDTSAAMGAQGVATLADLLYECADADMGMLGESRSSLALTYRTRGDLDARRDLELDYSAAVLSAPPAIPEDDLGVVNDVTAQRSTAGTSVGSSSRFEVATGALSTAAPPDGIGTYARTFGVNVFEDWQLKHVAGWLAHSGSAEDARIPNVQLALHRTAIADGSTLAAQVMALDCGDTIAITDLPAPLPPDDALLLVQGYQETLGKFTWDLIANTTPGSVHRTGTYTYDTVNGYGRYDTAGSTLNAGITTTATTLVLDCTDTDDTWTTSSAQYPFDIVIGGERITLTTAPGATSPQTFTSCTRSVNGVVKAHSAGDAASLAEPIYYAVDQ